MTAFSTLPTSSQAPSSELWRPEDSLAKRLFSSSLFFLPLITLAMAWVSFSLPGCGSELDAKQPSGVDLIGGTDVAAEGTIFDDCSTAGCETKIPIDGTFHMHGKAVYALLGAVAVGLALAFHKGMAGFRLRAAVALSGAILMGVVAIEPVFMLGMSWEGTSTRPDVEPGNGPILGVVLFVAIAAVTVGFATWEDLGLKGRTLMIIGALPAVVVVSLLAGALALIFGIVALIGVPALPAIAHSWNRMDD